MAKKSSSRKKSSAASGKKKASTRKTGEARKKATSRKAASSGGRSNGKSPLSRTELKEFRKLLLEKRRELVGDMSGIEAEAFGADRGEATGDISDHPADAGTDNFEQEFSLGLLESERLMLQEIDEALGRIEEGTYGVCLGTGKPIGTPRLKARPWAKYGIEYARMVEKGLVKPGERIESDDEDDEDDEDDDE